MGDDQMAFRLRPCSRKAPWEREVEQGSGGGGTLALTTTAKTDRCKSFLRVCSTCPALKDESEAHRHSSQQLMPRP